MLGLWVLPGYNEKVEWLLGKVKKNDLSEAKLQTYISTHIHIQIPYAGKVELPQEAFSLNGMRRKAYERKSKIAQKSLRTQKNR